MQHTIFGDTGVCDMKAAGPHEFIGFGAMDVTKPYKFIRFGDIDGPKPYEFIGSGGFYIANTGTAVRDPVQFAFPCCFLVWAGRVRTQDGKGALTRSRQLVGCTGLEGTDHVRHLCLIFDAAVFFVFCLVAVVVCCL
jgi:hypothetical protein